MGEMREEGKKKGSNIKETSERSFEIEATLDLEVEDIQEFEPGIAEDKGVEPRDDAYKGGTRITGNVDDEAPKFLLV